MARTSTIVKTVRNNFVSIVNSLKTNDELIGDGKLISTRTLDGEEVVTFDVSRFKSLASMNGTCETIGKHVANIFDILQNSEKGRKLFESYGEPEAMYWKTAVSWQKDGKYGGANWDKLVDQWNSTKGDVEVVSQSFGKNKWEEWIVPESSVRSTVAAARKKLGNDCPLYAPPEDAKEVTAELVKDMLGELV